MKKRGRPRNSVSAGSLDKWAAEFVREVLRKFPGNKQSLMINRAVKFLEQRGHWAKADRTTNVKRIRRLLRAEDERRKASAKKLARALLGLN